MDNLLAFGNGTQHQQRVHSALLELRSLVKDPIDKRNRVYEYALKMYLARSAVHVRFPRVLYGEMLALLNISAAITVFTNRVADRVDAESSRAVITDSDWISRNIQSGNIEEATSRYASWRRAIELLVTTPELAEILSELDKSIQRADTLKEAADSLSTWNRGFRSNSLEEQEVLTANMKDPYVGLDTSDRKAYRKLLLALLPLVDWRVFIYYPSALWETYVHSVFVKKLILNPTRPDFVAQILPRNKRVLDEDDEQLRRTVNRQINSVLPYTRVFYQLVVIQKAIAYRAYGNSDIDEKLRDAMRKHYGGEGDPVLDDEAIHDAEAGITQWPILDVGSEGIHRIRLIRVLKELAGEVQFRQVDVGDEIFYRFERAASRSISYANVKRELDLDITLRPPESKAQSNDLVISDGIIVLPRHQPLFDKLLATANNRDALPVEFSIIEDNMKIPICEHERSLGDLVEHTKRAIVQFSMESDRPPGSALPIELVERVKNMVYKIDRRVADSEVTTITNAALRSINVRRREVHDWMRTALFAFDDSVAAGSDHAQSLTELELLMTTGEVSVVSAGRTSILQRGNAIIDYIEEAETYVLKLQQKSNARLLEDELILTAGVDISITSVPTLDRTFTNLPIDDQDPLVVSTGVPEFKILSSAHVHNVVARDNGHTRRLTHDTVHTLGVPSSYTLLFGPVRGIPRDQAGYLLPVEAISPVVQEAIDVTRGEKSVVQDEAVSSLKQAMLEEWETDDGSTWGGAAVAELIPPSDREEIAPIAYNVVEITTVPQQTEVEWPEYVEESRMFSFFDDEVDIYPRSAEDVVSSIDPPRGAPEPVLPTAASNFVPTVNQRTSWGEPRVYMQPHGMFSARNAFRNPPVNAISIGSRSVAGYIDWMNANGNHDALKRIELSIHATISGKRFLLGRTFLSEARIGPVKSAAARASSSSDFLVTLVSPQIKRGWLHDAIDVPQARLLETTESYVVYAISLFPDRNVIRYPSDGEAQYPLNKAGDVLDLTINENVIKYYKTGLPRASPLSSYFPKRGQSSGIIPRAFGIELGDLIGTLMAPYAKQHGALHYKIGGRTITYELYLRKMLFGYVSTLYMNDDHAGVRKFVGYVLERYALQEGNYAFKSTGGVYTFSDRPEIRETNAVTLDVAVDNVMPSPLPASPRFDSLEFSFRLFDDVSPIGEYESKDVTTSVSDASSLLFTTSHANVRAEWVRLRIPVPSKAVCDRCADAAMDTIQKVVGKMNGALQEEIDALLDHMRAVV